VYKSITIKIGSNVLTDANGRLDRLRMAHLSSQIAELCQKGIRVILVSSGAVAAGRSLISKSQPKDLVAARQLLSAVGQVQLLAIYSELLAGHAVTCAQVLVTKQDFRTREHYLNMKNCFSVLLDNNIVPIVNENDAVSVTELMFTDNDELAGLVATMMNTEACFILSNVDGIYSGNPQNRDSKLIEVVKSSDIDLSGCISSQKSDFGRGGMLTKAKVAINTAAAGINVHIANGTKNNVITDLALNSSQVAHTRFPAASKAPAVKKWMAASTSFTQWEIYINKGAAQALASPEATSLLLAGVTDMCGEFKKGDLLRIIDHNQKLIGIGRAQYDRKTAQEHWHDKKYRPLVHYDYLFMFPV
jgi:glutamate 5-kinase